MDNDATTDQQSTVTQQMMLTANAEAGSVSGQ
jgi:hypothetical protein